MDTIGVSQTDFLSGEISMTFDLEKARDAAKSRSWQITGDRITAIDQGLRFLEWSNAKNGSVETKKHIATLQTMLEEASDEHGFER
jgi:hypothetical protein